MTRIHSTAVVSPKAELASDCEIGPHAIVEDDVILGAGCVVRANAVICAGTSMGSENEVHYGAVIGHVPQDKHFVGASTRTRIGNKNVFREHCQIHRGSRDGSTTEIGNGNLIMALAHVAHDCRIEDDVVICNNTLLAGHIHVESRAVISGNVVVHQFSRIGRLAMVGGLSAVPRDVPPFMMAVGNRPCVVVGLNTVGLRRAGVDHEGRLRLRNAYRILYRSRDVLPDAVERIEALGGREIEHLVAFLRATRRGLLAGPRFEDEGEGGDEIENGDE
ncbi:MAG TPA: acyl-ACP--UDP-N-acetylglucosamine O-acyltransferase [Planctomycetota bacterium]|nr:acyl-ACP--UDP-N-acetylglucosamine O-acyltransferase [Planctomycetota bacterium]